MEKMFETAVGSVTGRDHLLAGKNNQDAYILSMKDDLIIAIVADGCSDSYKAGHISRNEAGAQIGVRLLERSIRFNMHLMKKSAAFFWEVVRQNLLNNIKQIAICMGGELKEIVCNYFLFTCVGAIISSEKTWIFSVGDGVYCINGEMKNLGPFPGNAPPYIAYSLLDTSLINQDPTKLSFSVNLEADTENISSILIGTDGVLDLAKAENKKLPGKSDLVGPISQFWTKDIYFKNADKVRRQLAMINYCYSEILWEEKKLNRENGYLPDDTTLIAIRRRKGEEA